MNVCTYTLNLGSYDHYHGCPELNPRWDNLYVTDHEFEPPENWGRNVFLTVPTPTGDPKRAVCRFKILTHHLPHYHNISVWIDASFKLKQPIDKLVQDFAESSDQIRMFPHPRRNCTYQEAQACLAGKLDDPDIITRQMAQYIEEGLPVGYGMVAAGLIFRKNTMAVNAFNMLWANAYEKGSRRDQLSVMYAAWKLGMKIGHLDKSLYSNDYFHLCCHRTGHETIRIKA